MLLTKLTLFFLLFSSILLACPENSLCPDQQKSAFTAWKNFLATQARLKTAVEKEKKLQEFHQKFGVPVPFLLQQKKDFPAATWRSSCAFHRRPQKSLIVQGLGFIQKTRKQQAFFPRLQQYKAFDQTFTLDPLLLWSKKGNQWQAQTYFIPHQEFPLFAQNQKLYFMLESQGFYYQLIIHAGGNWQVKMPEKFHDKYPKLEETTCPEAVKQQSKNYLRPFDLQFYQSTRCFKLWDQLQQEMKLVQGYFC